MSYFPKGTLEWEIVSATEGGFDPSRLKVAVELAQTFESPWPYDLDIKGTVPGLTDIEKPPYNEPLGSYKQRGCNNGCVIKGGKIAAQWGDVERVDMTFSIAKSYLSVLMGIAIGDGLITNVDALVSDTVKTGEFDSEQNKTIRWRHLLEQTSEWEGTLWNKPDLIDRNRQVGSMADNSLKGEHRDLQKPGTFYEYNDVRVNLLALSLLYAFRRPLPEILKERIMDPIGASKNWVWNGYRNSFVEVDGKKMQSVPGGTHWGGGIQISTIDHARFALMVHNNGVWDGVRLLPEGWCSNLSKPSQVNKDYGFLWWLNTNKVNWPCCPANSYAAIGAGTSIIWISPTDDIIVVARWIDEKKVAELLAAIFKSQI
jgi:CubicO group peptidase (beta-lactamase class C family)